MENKKNNEKIVNIGTLTHPLRTKEALPALDKAIEALSEFEKATLHIHQPMIDEDPELDKGINILIPWITDNEAIYVRAINTPLIRKIVGYNIRWFQELRGLINKFTPEQIERDIASDKKDTEA